MKPLLMKVVALKDLEMSTLQGWHFVKCVVTSRVETAYVNNAAGGFVVQDTWCLVGLDEESSVAALARELESYKAQVSAHQKVNEALTAFSKRNDQLEAQLKSANEIARNAEDARLKSQTTTGHLNKMFEKVTRAIGDKTMKEILRDE